MTRWSLAVLALSFGATAQAQTLPPAPYCPPFALRGVAGANAFRITETLASFEGPGGERGHTLVTGLFASRRLGAITPLARVSFVHHDPGAASSGSGISNPLLGASYGRAFSRVFRVGAFAGTTLAIGSGGGSAADPAAAAAMTGAANARTGMDNALFAVNYWTLTGGVGVARVTAGSTLQAEATLFQLTRVRGARAQDASRTNLTAGLHAARFLAPRASVSGELRFQRWLSDALPVRRDPSAREQASAALGARFHFRLGRSGWLRPGVAYVRALDAPLSVRDYGVVELDVPVTF